MQAAQLALALCCAVSAGGAAAAPAEGLVAASGRSPTAVADEISSIVEQRFYAPERLERIGWRAAVERARDALARASSPAARTAILRDLVATLGASHTEYYPRTDPDYWALASIFQPVLERTCPRESAPPLPVTHDDIGVLWKRLDGGWFVAGVFAGGPAELAGLLVGDRVLAARGQPFSPVEAFAGRAGQSVTLEVQRTRGGAPVRVIVTPRRTRPADELTQASADSWRILERGGRRFAYVRLWTWTSLEVQRALLDALGRSNAARVDGFVLDLRDGWGGADPGYLGMFWREVPVLEEVRRDGTTQLFDRQIRKPAVLLVNHGTRSGKEVVAYGAKTRGLARLVGERTAGAVVFGQPFCLGDGSLLLLAVSDARVDGERLEGRGVVPDVEVPFDPRYAGGRDPQLDRALDLLAGAAR